MQQATPGSQAFAPSRLARLNGLAGSGTIAVGIKLFGAALNFLMFVVAAIVTDARDFGLFSTAFAGASLVSFVNVVGQQSVILRFWPQYAGAGNLPVAYAVLRRSMLTVGGGLAVGAGLILLTGLLPWVVEIGVPEWTALCVGAALMSVVLGWSEFLSSVLRARERLFGALLPRDVVWRVVVIAVLLGASWRYGHLSAVTVTWLSAATLGLCVLGQTIRLLADTMAAERAILTPAETAEFSKVTLGLWGVNAVPPAWAQINTLLVAGILGAEIAGAVFVAERTARLIDLPLNGINQVLAPHISRNYYLNGAGSVQYAASSAALVSFAVSLGVMLVFACFGTFLLGMFDPAYATTTYWVVLLTFGLSSTVAAACGPTALVLQLTGHQNALLRVFTAISVAGLPLIALAAWQFGPIGAAAAIALNMIVANVVPVRIAIRALGINPTIFGWKGFRPG